jgi:hypothetical protein
MSDTPGEWLTRDLFHCALVVDQKHVDMTQVRGQELLALSYSQHRPRACADG